MSDNQASKAINLTGNSAMAGYTMPFVPPPPPLPTTTSPHTGSGASGQSDAGGLERPTNLSSSVTRLPPAAKQQTITSSPMPYSPPPGSQAPQSFQPPSITGSSAPARYGVSSTTNFSPASYGGGFQYSSPSPYTSQRPATSPQVQARPTSQTPAASPYNYQAGQSPAPASYSQPYKSATATQPESASKTPLRKKTDAFVANDPFRPSPSNKVDKISDATTFDDIPTAVTTPAPKPFSASPYASAASQYQTAPPSQSPAYSSPAPAQFSSPYRPQTYASSPFQAAPSMPQQARPQTYASSTSQATPFVPQQVRPQSYATSEGPPPVVQQYRPNIYAPPASPALSIPTQQASPAPYGLGVSATPAAVPQQPAPRPNTPPQDHQNHPTFSPSPYHRPQDPAQMYPGSTPPPTNSSPEDNLPHTGLSTDDHLSSTRPEPPSKPSTPRPLSPVQPAQQPQHEGRPSSTFYNPYDADSQSQYQPLYEPFRYESADTTYPPYSPRPFSLHYEEVSRRSRFWDLFRWPFGHKNAAMQHPFDPSLSSWDEEPSFTKVVLRFLFRTLPSQVYLHFLLRLPALYFGRVARIFEEADLTLPEIKKMALETASEGKFDLHTLENSAVPPQYEKLKATWESFIDSVMREWKTFNIISVLLLSAILTILQIDAAAADPVSRYTALFSLICALISLLFGCMYIIRFGSMRKTYKAAEWALEAKKSKTTLFWNVWVLLAMPVVWLTWSIVLYIVCIMSFVWRTGGPADSPPPELTAQELLAVRITLTVVLGLGIIYGALVLVTFRRYGEAMDKAWKQRIDGWLEEKATTAPDPYLPIYYGASYPPPQSVVYPSYQDNYSSATSDYYSQPPPPAPASAPLQRLPSYRDVNYGYGYTSDSKTRSSDTKASAYREPTDATDVSRPDSADSSTSTVFVTQYNTLANKTSHFEPDEGTTSSTAPSQEPAYPTQSGAPPPFQYQPPNVRYVPQRVQLAVAPPPSLPPIPGTPLTPLRSSANSYASPTDSLGGKKMDDSLEQHVHFKSPPDSAQGDVSPQSGSTSIVGKSSEQPGPSQLTASPQPPALAKTTSAESFDIYDYSKRFGG